MKCEDAAKALPLLLYGELSFEAEDELEAHVDACAGCRRELDKHKAILKTLDAVKLEIAPAVLIEARQRLRETLAHEPPVRAKFWERLREAFTVRSGPAPAGLQPVAALALVAMGFFGARLVPQGAVGRFDTAGLTEPLTCRVKYVEPACP